MTQRTQIVVPDALTGRVVTPDDARYRLLRSTYTRVHSPALVILPENAQEVGTALSVARDSGLPLAVRSGGHSLAGTSSNDGGIVIDLSRMSDVSVIDRAARLVRVEAGARWGRVARDLASHGLAISSGDHGNVGVGGLATAGGIGWLVRKYGLTIDRMRAAELVLADGTVHTVSATADSELFWGIRGAGSTLAIVTAFVFEAAEVSTVAVAQLDLEVSVGQQSLVAWDEYMRGAPPELTSSIMLLGGSGRAAIASVTAVFAGSDPADAERAFKPLTEIGQLRAGSAQLVPYRALVPVAHEHPNVGQQNSFTRNGFVDTLGADVEELVLGLAETPGFMLQLRALGGAIADVDPDATAFANRHQSTMIISTVWSAQELTLLDQQLTPLRSHYTGAYVNFDSDRGADVVELAFPPDTRGRIRALKNRVDPDGLFPELSG